ncbi:hypothetical protein Tco_0749171 [Tanacetum coccineum]|uniref:Uncharacterized protein n=1 Tax=Tanacetum coccineum TaxID=301880 RepID=A0ABQ4Z0H5_9ASTR
MIELQPSRGKLPTKPLFKYLSLIGHKGISTFVGSITQNLADLQDDQRRFVSFMTIQLFTSRIEDRLLIYGQIRRVIQLSDDQLFIKALEEFKPSVYGENYEEENENATHEKGYNASKKRKQAIEEFAFNKASYYDWDKLADDEKANNLPRSEFIMTLLREINEIAVVVELL